MHAHSYGGWDGEKGCVWGGPVGRRKGPAEWDRKRERREAVRG